MCVAICLQSYTKKRHKLVPLVSLCFQIVSFAYFTITFWALSPLTMMLSPRCSLAIFTPDGV